MSGSVREGKTLTAQITERRGHEVLTECDSPSQEMDRGMPNNSSRSKGDEREE